MKEDFIKQLLEKHTHSERYPPTSSISRWVTKILLVLFPEQSKKQCKTEEDVEFKISTIEHDLTAILSEMSDRLPSDAASISKKFITTLPAIHFDLAEDAIAIMQGDPAAKSEYEVIRAYPGFYAIAFYRIAHELYKLDIPLLPRFITEYAHSKTGIDINPGAKISAGLFIDHGTGIVIGETAEIGKNVKIYQGVTLGALSVSKDLASTKRHPTIEDNVVIYANACILGGETIIGHNSTIGGNVWLTKSIPPYTTVYHKAQIDVQNRENIKKPV